MSIFVGNDKSQLALFKARHDLISVRSGWYWLRNVGSSRSFSYVDTTGMCGNSRAAYPLGVRPVFLVY